MASGDSLLLFPAAAGVAPGATFATFDILVGASTPAESVLILDFDDTTQEYIDFYGVMPQHYSSTTGVTLKLFYSAAEAATDVVEWQAAFRRVADDAEDLDTTAHTYVFNATVDTAPSVVGEVGVATITFTDGADMDSVVAGDYFILRVSRDPSPSSGTDVTGDASIHAVEIQDT
jgi:hypothetical protein